MNHPIQKNKVKPIAVIIAGMGFSIELIEPAYEAMKAYGTELMLQANKNLNKGIFVKPAMHAVTSGKIGAARESNIIMKPCDENDSLRDNRSDRDFITNIINLFP